MRDKDQGGWESAGHSEQVLGGPDLRHHQPIQLNWPWVPNVCPDFGVHAGPAAERPD